MRNVQGIKQQRLKLYYLKTIALQDRQVFL